MMKDELRISLCRSAGKPHCYSIIDGCDHTVQRQQHILKLPIGISRHHLADFSSSVENEWLCMHLLATIGPVAATDHHLVNKSVERRTFLIVVCIHQGSGSCDCLKKIFVIGNYLSLNTKAI